MNAITTTNLSKRYDGLMAVDNLNLSIEQKPVNIGAKACVAFSDKANGEDCCISKVCFDNPYQNVMQNGCIFIIFQCLTYFIIKI